MKTYQVSYSSTGDLSEGKVLTDFLSPWNSATPLPKTEFRAVSDGALLHFSFEVEDEDIVLARNSDAGKAALGSDRVELFFASSADLSTPYYGAEMAPNGNVFDYRANFYRQIEGDWSFESLHFEGQLDEFGYSVVGKIALEELRDLGCLRSQKMTTGVYRAEFSQGSSGSIQERWICWVAPETEKADFHVPSSFGTFYFQEKV